MNCPKCSSDGSVIDSRPTDHATTIRRRRECNTCKHRYTTYEVDADTFQELQADSRVALPVAILFDDGTARWLTSDPPPGLGARLDQLKAGIAHEANHG